MSSRLILPPAIPSFPRWVAIAGLLLHAIAAAGAETLRVGFDAVLEPIAFVDAKGQPTGFAADYVRAVGKQAGFEVEFVTGPKERLQTEFREGRIAVIALLVFTDERAKVMDFTPTYLTLRGAVFVRKGTNIMKSIADFSGRKIAVSRGNVTHDYMKAHPEWGAQLLPVDSTEAALRAVQSGECEAAVNVDLVGQKIIRERGLDQITRTDTELPGLNYKYCMAVHKGDAALLRRLNEAQLAVHERGEFAAIYEEWIGPLQTPGITWRQLRPFVVPIAMLIAAVTAAFAWQRRNLQQLAVHTEALRLSKERLKLVLQSGRHSLWDWHVPENRVVRSPMLAYLLGYEPNEIASTHEGLARLLHPEDQPAMARFLSVIAQPGQDDFSAESRLKTKSGEWRWIATAGRVLKRGPDGRALRAVGTHTDITQRKEAEEVVRHLNRDLERRVDERTVELAARVAEVEQLNQELEAFSYSVSHDLRSPLRNISGFLELLAQRAAGRLDSEGDRFVATVTTEARRMSQLIDDLLAFSRIGRATVTMQPVDLNELVVEAREQLRSDAGARPIEWTIAPLPRVLGDRSLLRQVFVNLLGNAVKFSRQRDPAIIEVGVTMPPAGGATASFYVRDNGAGFNPKYADKLFGVFQRLHTARDFEGTGIGLANVKRIVERHGGRVWAEGQTDRGATFHFTLVSAEA